MPFHHLSGGARSHTTKRGYDTQAATGHMSRRSARAAPSSVFYRYFEPLTPPQAFDPLVVHQPPASHCECDRCKPGDVTGSVVSPCSLCQDQLVQRQVRYGPPRPFILLLKPFDFLQLVGSHTAILLMPAIERLFRYLHLPDRVDAWHSLAAKHLNLP